MVLKIAAKKTFGIQLISIFQLIFYKENVQQNDDAVTNKSI